MVRLPNKQSNHEPEQPLTTVYLSHMTCSQEHEALLGRALWESKQAQILIPIAQGQVSTQALDDGIVLGRAVAGD